MWKSEKKTFELCYSFQETLILFSNEAMYQKIFEVGELPSHCVWVAHSTNTKKAAAVSASALQAFH